MIHLDESTPTEDRINSAQIIAADLIILAWIVACILAIFIFAVGSAHAQAPEADPRPAVPYVWGYFDGAWWMTVDGIGWQPDLSGQICIQRSGTSDVRCYRHLEWMRYEYNGDRNWYRTDYDCVQGEWYVYYASLGGIYADIRQPNLYLIWCNYFPDTKA